MYWTPPDYTAPVLDWFNTYVVQSVTQTDPTGGAPNEVTDYQYLGGAAWHYDDNEVVKAKYRTYGQFRGYGDVRTLTGDGVNDPQTETGVTYYRGMSKDNNSTVVNVTDSHGGTHDDVSQLAGQPLEQHLLQLASRRPGRSLDDHLVLGVGRGGDPDPDRAARPDRELRRDGGDLDPAGADPTGTTTWRYTETDTSYDATTSDANFGLPLRVYTHTGAREHRLRLLRRPPPTRRPTPARTSSACPPRPRPTRSPAAGSPRDHRRRSHPG